MNKYISTLVIIFILSSCKKNSINEDKSKIVIKAELINNKNLSIINESTLSQLKKKWKHQNLEIIKEKTADIDQDGKEDKIYVLWSSAKNNFPIYIILQRENNYINNIMNENILSPVHENSTGIGLTDIVCKRGLYNI